MATAIAPRPSATDRAIASGNWPTRHPHGYPIAGVKNGWSSWVVESSTRPGMDHAVESNLDGELTCSCEAGIYDQPDCLHRAAVRLCMDRGIWAAYCLCVECGTTRVARTGQCCPGCQNLRASAAPLPAAIIWCPRCASVKVEAPGIWCQGCVDYRAEVEAAAASSRVMTRKPRMTLVKSSRPAVAVATPRTTNRPRVTDCHRCETCGAIDPDPLHIAFCG